MTFCPVRGSSSRMYDSVVPAATSVPALLIASAYTLRIKACGAGAPPAAPAAASAVPAAASVVLLAALLLPLLLG
jgi:hypothetical protein